MEPKGSLHHSQVPATCPYPEPVRSSQYPHTSYFLKIHLNIILPSTPGSPRWSLSLRFPYQNPIYASSLPHICFIPRPSHSSWFYYPNNNGWAVQIILLLIMMQFPAFPVTSSLLDPNILLSTLFSNTLSLHELEHKQWNLLVTI